MEETLELEAPTGVCRVPGCGGKIAHTGYCSKHYQRVRHHGNPYVVLPAGFQRGDLNPSRKPDRRAEISAWRKGKPLSIETRMKQSISLRKRLQEPEMKEKWRKAATGRKPSAETRAKLSKSRASTKISSLIHRLDEIYSKYIRTKHSENGYIRCFTCDTVKPFAEIDCGHFVSRQHRATRYMEENTQPQCRYCNRFNEGRKDVFAVRLMKKYGPDILERLQQEKHRVMNFTHFDLHQMIEEFKAKLQTLERA